MNNRDKILQISKKLGLSHVSSCLSVLPILEEIYSRKKPEDIVLMDNGHASLAHYIVLEKYITRNFDGNIIPIDAEELFHKYGVHSNRDVENGLYASNGSLGHNLGISIGFAVANPDKTIYVIVSDGSMMEGSNAEALRIAKTLEIKNLEIHANLNGYTATSVVDLDYVEGFIRGFGFPVISHRTNNGLEVLQGVKGHYFVLKEDQN